MTGPRLYGDLQTFMQGCEDIPLRIIDNHIINLGKKVILIAYHSLNIGRLLRSHAINFKGVGNGGNQHFTLAYDPFCIDIQGMAQVGNAGIDLLD